VRIVLVALASMLATTGFLEPKWFAPLGFAGLSSLLIIVLRALSPQLALWSTVTLAFFNAAWIALVIRQIVFELSTAGHLTNAFDSCTVALLPFLVGFLLLAALVPSALVTVLQRVLRNAGSQSASAQPFAAFPWPAWRIALVLSFAAGAIAGALSWHDMQINQPCL